MRTQKRTVPGKGVGNKDYTVGASQSVEPFITPTLRQAKFGGVGSFTLDVLAFPIGHHVLFSMPQEDGTFDVEASSIPVFFYDVHVSIMGSWLVGGGFYRYDSYDDALAGIIKERYAVKFGYGSVNVKFTKGIRTVEGDCYGVFAGVWPDTDTCTVHVECNGIASDLTLPWMEK